LFATKLQIRNELEKNYFVNLWLSPTALGLSGEKHLTGAEAPPSIALVWCFHLTKLGLSGEKHLTGAEKFREFVALPTALVRCFHLTKLKT